MKTAERLAYEAANNRALADDGEEMSTGVNFMKHSLDDALIAARELEHANRGLDFAPIIRFLEALAKMAAPETRINSDAEGFIIDGADQNGFENIDDNANLMVVHQNDLIKYVMKQRGAHWVSTKNRQPALGLVVKGWDSGAIHAGRQVDNPKAYSYDWFIELPPLPEPGK